METVFNYENPIAYPGGKSQYTLLIQVCGNIIQIIGFIAFVRGWVLLARIGQQGSRPGELGKAIMHMIGGLLAANMFGTWKLITGFLGL